MKYVFSACITLIAVLVLYFAHLACCHSSLRQLKPKLSTGQVENSTDRNSKESEEARGSRVFAHRVKQAPKLML